MKEKGRRKVRKRRFLALGLAMTMTLSLMAPGTAAASDPSDEKRQAQIALAIGEKDNDGNVTVPGALPGTTRTFFDENDDIRDWFNASGFAADGVQDRSWYYEEYVANGKKPTKNYKVVEEDGWIKGDGTYLSDAEYKAEGSPSGYTFKSAEKQFVEALNSRAPVIQVNAKELELGFHYLEDNGIPSGPVKQVSDYDSGSKKFPPITSPVIMNGADKYHTEGVKEQIDASQEEASQYNASQTDNSCVYGTGVSEISLYSHLTLFSTSGCMLRHVGFDINGVEDVILRNFQFEGMYEWDDQTEEICAGADFTTRKRYGWGYFSVKQSRNVWVDHCTFGFAFDGNDLTNGSSASITWCQFGVQNILDGKDENTHETPVSITMNGSTPVYSGTRWFQSQGSELWKNILYMEEIYQKYKAGILPENQRYHYYTKYRDKGATPQELLRYGAMHSKVHLVGSGEKDLYTNVEEKLTLAFNKYTNIIQRIPMVRSGNAHMYNCIVDNKDYQDNSAKLNASDRKVGVGYTTYLSVNNARNGATIGTDTCIFNEVTPNCGVERQSLDLSNLDGGKEVWKDILSSMINHNLTVNSKVTIDGQTYTGSSWDNNGENNLLNKRWKWYDKSTIGDFKWSKWNLEVFRNEGALDTNAIEKTMIDYSQKNGYDALYKNYYEGADKLGYDYQCFTLDYVEKMLEEYGGAMEQLYGEDETMFDYIQPYNRTSAEKNNYSKKVLVDTGNEPIEGKNNNIYLVKKDESITLPTGSAITKKGYVFAGWQKGTYDEATGTWAINENPVMEVTITGDDNFSEEYYFATWEKRKYEITFDSMGGSPVSDIWRGELDQTLRNALKAMGKEEAFPTSTKEGATLLGWYSYEPSTKTYIAKYAMNSKITDDITLYARWKNTIQFNTNGGSAVGATTVNSGNKLSEVNAPTKEGYTFAGWYTDEALTTPFNAEEAIWEPMTLYAKWIEGAASETVTITFETNGGTTMAVIVLEKGATAGVIAVPEKEGYRFDGWYTDKALTTPFNAEEAIMESMTLYAKWIKNENPPTPGETVTITFETNGGATMAAIEVEKGATAGAIAVPKKSESIFDGWYTDEALATPFDPNAALDTDMKLYAAWSLIGDVNRDGRVAVNDALLILQHLADKAKLTEKQISIADIDGDGIKVKDALYILQRLADKLDSFDSVKKK